MLGASKEFRHASSTVITKFRDCIVGKFASGRDHMESKTSFGGVQWWYHCHVMRVAVFGATIMLHVISPPKLDAERTNDFFWLLRDIEMPDSVGD
jgi:hypothetical protein